MRRPGTGRPRRKKSLWILRCAATWYPTQFSPLREPSGRAITVRRRYRRGYTGISGRVLARTPRRNRCPEPNKLLTPCRVRSTWRMQLAPSRPIRPPSAYRHSNLLSARVLRRPVEPAQYARGDDRKLLRLHGIKAAMSRKGNCLDNAPMESFFGSLKTELVHRTRFRTRREARAALFEYIEIFYNQRRRHSSIG